MNPTTTHSSEVVGQLVLIETDPIRERVRHALAGFLAAVAPCAPPPLSAAGTRVGSATDRVARSDCVRSCSRDERDDHSTGSASVAENLADAVDAFIPQR